VVPAAPAAPRTAPRRRIALVVGVTLWVAAGPLGAVAEARAAGGEYVATVVRVVDGDTVAVRTATARKNVRLAQIDAPERAQPHGAEATRALSAMVLGREVRLEVVTVDRYGREVVELYADGRHVNRDLVRQGHAWVYQRYAVDAELNELESAARSERAGLWALPETDRIPPWSWRAAGRAAPGRAPAEGERYGQRLGRDAGGPYACGAKHLCRQMADCEEAMYHLRQCGVASLDGDRDGVPCERLCGRPAGGDEQ
jgi:endonuclease YncB( thermonuclease family)